MSRSSLIEVINSDGDIASLSATPFSDYETVRVINNDGEMVYAQFYSEPGITFPRRLPYLTSYSNQRWRRTMAKRGLPFIVSFKAWNTSTNLPQSGDADNIHVEVSKDGLDGISATNRPTEILYSNGDSTGRYSFSATASEADANTVRFLPRSTTQYVNCEDVFVVMETQWGVRDVTISAVDNTPAPLDAVYVKVENANRTATINTLLTDANGEAKFNLDDGVYYVTLQKSMVNFTNPNALVVNNNTTVAYTGTIVEPTSATANLQTVYGNVHNVDGSYAVLADIKAVVDGKNQKYNNIIYTNVISEAKTNSNGYFELQLAQGIRYKVVIQFGDEVNFYEKIITIDTNGTKNLYNY